MVDPLRLLRTLVLRPSSPRSSAGAGGSRGSIPVHTRERTHPSGCGHIISTIDGITLAATLSMSFPSLSAFFVIVPLRTISLATAFCILVETPIAVTQINHVTSLNCLQGSPRTASSRSSFHPCPSSLLLFQLFDTIFVILSRDFPPRRDAFGLFRRCRRIMTVKVTRDAIIETSETKCRISGFPVAN